MIRKKLSCQVTIIAALVFGLVLSLILTTVQSAALSTARLKADMVTYAGVTSEFSQYFAPLFEEFQVLALEETATVAKEIEQFMYRSLKSDMGYVPVTLSGVTVDNQVNITDYSGLKLKENVLKYMKYGNVSNIVNMLLQSEEVVRRSEAVNSLSESLEEGTEIVSKMNRNLLTAIYWLDGIAVNEDTFKVKYDYPMYSGNTFLKMAVMSRTPAVAGITDGRVYGAIGGQLQLIGDGIIAMVHELDRDNVPGAKYKLLDDLLYDAQSAGYRVIKYLEAYQKDKEELGNFAGDFQRELESSKDIIGDECYGGFLEENKRLQEMAQSNSGDYLNAPEALVKVRNKVEVLAAARHLLAGLKSVGADKRQSVIRELVELLDGYSFADMQVDYSQVRFVKENKVLGYIQGICNQIGRSTFAKVMEGLEYSKNKVNVSTLAINMYSKDKDKLAKDNTEITEKAVFTAYLADKFMSYSDVELNKADYSGDGLKYEQEFILGGNGSDEDNLRDTVGAAVSLRQGINMMCLITDSKKKEEAYALAAAVLGFTGSKVIIKAGQWLLLTGWARSEAVMDVKILVNGGSLELYKAKRDWIMSLDRVLASDYRLPDNLDRGQMGYDEFLCFLIFLQNPAKVYYGTMTAMEMRMIEAGYEQFRMADFLCGISGRAELLIDGRLYERNFEYEY